MRQTNGHSIKLKENKNGRFNLDTGRMKTYRIGFKSFYRETSDPSHLSIMRSAASNASSSDT